LKILIVGSDKIFAIENFYVKYLREAGLKVSSFLAPNFFYDYYQKSIFNRIAFRSGLSSIYKNINEKFREAVEYEKPDLIWVFKGMELFPESLVWVKTKGIKLVNYNPDNPFLFSGRGSGNKNISNSVGLYDMHFTYNLEIKEKLEKEFQASTYFLPFGFEVDDDVYSHCEAIDEVIETCFLGNPDSIRSTFITKLADAGIHIAVFGHDWKKFVNHSKIKIHDAVYAIEQWEILRKYRVQLNLMRPHNENSHNMRTFEVPGIGGIMLAPDTREHRIFFKDENEVFLFKNTDDCKDKINRLLKLSPEEAFMIRCAARASVMQGKHSYKNRTQQVIKELKYLLSSE
jgi:spore maturation protein CgeB